jgi:serine/threonine protein kinase
LRAGAFPLTRAIEYFDQILQAAAFMHGGLVRPDGQRVAIVHRDLKPENILVARRQDSPDIVKVTDFGLAVEIDSLLRWVETGGDLTYMAPESFSHHVSSTQSDVYTLALLFYEMLTGHNPFGEVGAHLRGTPEEKEQALRQLHVTARQTERFRFLEQHEELRQRPAMAQVIRNALAADMSSRAFTDACELRAAWEKAKCTDAGSPPKVSPWDTVRRLTNEAVQCFRVGNTERGQDLLRQAIDLNRDKSRVPDPMVVGRTYLLVIEQMLRQGKTDEAGRLATEGYQRRRCRSTCLCMARYYQSVSSPLAARFEQEAESCGDQE